MGLSIIVLAAGKSERMDSEKNKVFLEINGKHILDYSIEFFQKYKQKNELILVCSETDFNYCLSRYKNEVDKIVLGGNTRQKSVYNGLIKSSHEYVMIHDAARPYLTAEIIDKLYNAVVDVKAATVATRVKDTIVEVTDNRIVKPLNREFLIALQTPQVFDRELILKAHEKAIEQNFSATDDTTLINKFTNVMPEYVIGDYRSIKLTTKEDFLFLEKIL